MTDWIYKKFYNEEDKDLFVLKTQCCGSLEWRHNDTVVYQITSVSTVLLNRLFRRT